MNRDSRNPYILWHVPFIPRHFVQIPLDTSFLALLSQTSFGRDLQGALGWDAVSL